ncbi:regulatory solute carrier protein family 1 member 1 isoform X1 [Cricetulus griseus]|uniref:DNA-damage inducible protein 2 n=1 Tax=Cricetulus griseus TaxID=10029 RepID=A0A8C2QPC3_CRIGR|nr:regulatory solute carrier protein family 1 member 1 isoform X1 [Cricetulus griseus]XP_027255741.1 regulatory solute carrier protein family 1 member 1 isoform X2 [Cricetulus griseus]
MLLTVYCVRRDLSEVTFSLQVDADFELHNFRALCELESGIPAAESQIVYAERPLTDNHRSLASYGLKDGDVVILRQKENADPRPPVQFSSLPRIDFSSIAVPGTSNPQQRQLPRAQSQHSSPGEIAASPQGLDNPALLRDMLLANPHELSLLKERNPPLAEALLSGDLERFSRVLVEQQQDRARREQERIRLFSADPFDLEAQAKIEEDIRQQNIEENMTIAMEEAPESFGQVAMLYINCRVNGHPVKAFVDSGAQMTIMSQACAERCNIMRLVDRRWAGIAKGVGTQKIIGRVHLAQVQIEGDFLACSFSILEEQPMDMLLGLDMLKRHQCSIDLKKNVLVIGTTGSQTPFLPEGELPECARLAYGTGREDIRPEEIADQELAEAIQKSAEDAEKSSKESTSLGISSLLTSDGFNHPVPSSGQSPEVGSPTSLARSVSASVCAIKPSDPNSIEPIAMEAMKASAELQTNSKETEPPALQALPHLASPAGQDPAMPLRLSSEEAFVTDNPEKSVERRAQGLRVYLHTRQDTSLSLTTTGMHGLQGFVEEKSWHPENPNPSQVNGLQQHREPHRGRGQQDVPRDQECLCDTEDLELHGEKQQDQEKNVILEGVMKGDELQTSAGLVSTEESLLASGHCSCSCSETLMEVDTVEQSLVAVCSSSGRQKARTKSPSPSHLTSHNPSMETETVQCNPSCESMEHSISTRDLQPPEDNVEMSAMDSKDNISSSSPLSDHGQPSVEAPEEFCSSVTVALKELHDLLVISCKPASENASEDVSCQSEMEAESQTGILDHLGRRVQSEHLTISDQYPQVSCHQATSESEKIDTTCAGTEDGACTSFRGLGDSSSIGREGVPRPRESVRKSCSVAITSAKPADQSHCTSDVEISPTFVAGEEGTHSQPSEHMQNPGTASLETSDVCPGAAPPSHGSDPPATQSLSSPSALPPFVFPAADVNRILGAGFTLQEALGALHRVGGNADLALLVLLAKNIVVPT